MIAGESFSEIGEMLWNEAERTADSLFLYAEVEPGSIGPSAFRDGGDKVFMFYTSTDLSTKIMDTWYAAPEDKKWKAFFLTIDRGHLEVKFVYPGEWPDHEFYSDRVDQVVASKFGDKEVIYPPLSG
jgi:hypothetical protein